MVDTGAQYSFGARYLLPVMDDSAGMVDEFGRSLPTATAGTTPRVSIGLPVYNGERWLAEAVDSLLSQTFTDFELIISDNASTDGTEAMCRRYAELDSRVRYYRNDENIGGAPNASLTVQLARGEYFRWAAHDDRYQPTLLERLVDELDKRPEIVLAYTLFVGIDSDGRRLADHTCGWAVGQGWLRPSDQRLATDENGIYWSTQGTAPSPSQRFAEMVLIRGPYESTYGLIRLDVLRRTRLQEPYTASDVVMLCDLALRGPFFVIEEPLFCKRWHGANLHYERGPGRMAWSRPELAESGRLSFPHWLQLWGYVSTVLRAHLTLAERFRCGTTILRWMRRKWKALAWDVAFAVVMGLHSREWRKRCYAPETWTLDRGPMSTAPAG